VGKKKRVQAAASNTPSSTKEANLKDGGKFENRSTEKPAAMIIAELRIGVASFSIVSHQSLFSLLI
jgi:hypothetical protein